MNLMDLFVKISVDDDASDKVSGISESIGTKITKAAKVAAAAIGALSTAAAGLAKASIGEFADYEQLTGGVETLFKNSADIVRGYANEAYKTAGLSSNQYMETVTSFSASLLQGLGGDTEKAAKIANTAITDMADNANKMGSSLESIQVAYAGFAKDNYTLLDNLKLGYGGTQAEMARLINDSGVLGKAVEVTAESVKDVPFDKIIEAIHVIQTEMGITGTTAKEASETISGSWASTKAAWKNLLTAMADPTQDFEKVLNNFLGSVGTFGKNLAPRLENALRGVGKLIEGLAPAIAEALPVLVESVLPSLIDAGISMLESLIMGFADNAYEIGQAAANAALRLADALVRLAPNLINAGINFASSLISGILKGLEDVSPALKALVIGFMTYKTVLLVVKAAQTAVTLAQNLMNASFAVSPWGLVAAGLGLVVGGYSMFTSATDEANESMEKSLALLNSLDGAYGSYGSAMSSAGSYEDEYAKALREYNEMQAGMERMKASGYTATSYGSASGTYNTPYIGDQTFHVYLGEEKLTDMVVDIMKKEVRTS